jgi:L-rhamnose isomerase/sugar isomerase
MRLLLEYKFYEPALYHTDVSDWGQSLLMCQKLGDRALVLVDLGHHAQGTNVEHIVSTLLDEGRLGGFDLNARKYGDDDLFVGSINPFEIFLIMVELVAAEDSPEADLRRSVQQVLYKIDQCAMVEDNVQAMLRSVMAMQTAYAKALLVDAAALDEARQSGDVMGATQVLSDAFETDVRPLLAQVRDDLGVPADPLAAYRGSDEERSRREERLGTPAAWV